MYVWQHMQSNIKLVHVYRNIFSYSILIRIRYKSTSSELFSTLDLLRGLKVIKTEEATQ